VYERMIYRAPMMDWQWSVRLRRHGRSPTAILDIEKINNP
jgi:hypothetical protein